MMWTWKKYLVKKVDNDFSKTFYTICDEDNNEYVFSFKFYDLDKEIKVGDYFHISNNSLIAFKERPKMTYYLGPLNTEFSKRLDKRTEHEKFMIEIDGEVITYQRYYG